MSNHLTQNSSKMALLVEHHPAYSKSFGTPNLIKTLSTPSVSPFKAIVATDMAGYKPISGPWDTIPTLALFRPRSLLPKIGLGLLDNFFFKLQNSRVIQFLKKYNIDHLFFLITNNSRFAIFAAELPWAGPKDIYLVDDFVEDSYIYRISKTKAQNALDTLMLECDRVFTISPISAAKLSHQYNRSCEFLPLPINSTTFQASSENKDKQTSHQETIVIHHAGSIHHLYANTIVDFVNLLQDVIEQSNFKVILEFYGNISKKQFKNLFGNILTQSHPNLILKPAGNVPYPQLIQAQQRADFLLLVNSFLPHMQKQTQYSFSSKTIEYLVSGTSILLYAPPYSSLVAYLDSHQAAHILSDTDKIKACTRLEQIFKDSNRNAPALAAIELAKTVHCTETFFKRVTNHLTENNQAG